MYIYAADAAMLHFCIATVVHMSHHLNPMSALSVPSCACAGGVHCSVRPFFKFSLLLNLCTARS